MRTLFRYDSAFVRWLTRMGNLVLLNCLWVLCCLPIITIGASTTAMYRIAIDIAGDTDDLPLVRGFFAAFRSSFKPATCIWLILSVPALIIGINLWLYISGQLGNAISLFVICLLPLPLLLFVRAYVFAYVAMFEDKLSTTLKNCAIISISNLFRTMLMASLNILPVVLLLLTTDIFLRLLFVWLFFGFAFTAYLNAKLLLRAFRPYMDAAEEAEAEERAAQ